MAGSCALCHQLFCWRSLGCQFVIGHVMDQNHLELMQNWYNYHPQVYFNKIQRNRWKKFIFMEMLQDSSCWACIVLAYLVTSMAVSWLLIFIQFLVFFSSSLNLITHNMEYMFHFFIRMKNVRMMAQIYFEMRWGWHLLTFSDRRETDSHLSYLFSL